MSNGWILSEDGLAFVSADVSGTLSQGLAEIWQQKDGSGAYDDWQVSLSLGPIAGTRRCKWASWQSNRSNRLWRWAIL